MMDKLAYHRADSAHLRQMAGSILIALVLMAPICQRVVAQQAELMVEPDEIRIGEQARLVIDLEIPSGGRLALTDFDEMLAGDLELLHTQGPDTVGMHQGMIAVRITHVITSWEEGLVPVPRMEFSLVTESDTVMFSSPGGLLQVSGVDVDLSGPYRDINPIFLVPVRFWEVFRWVLLALAAGLVAYFVVRRLRNRKADADDQALWEKPDVPAHIAAISGLESLRRKQLWQKGQIKAYHSELTDIVRMYLFKRFGVNAMEMTTQEILQATARHLPGEDVADMLRKILETADLVKFAKLLPPDQAHEDALNGSLELVKKTIPHVA